VISEPGLDALRVAATLTHCLPALHLRLRTDEGQPLLDVGAAPPVPAAGAGLSMSPCSFRQQVIRARRRIGTGERVGFLTLAGDPAIEIGVPVGGRTFAGGIHRVAIGDTWIYAFGVTGAQDVYARAGKPVVDAWAGPVPDQLGLRPDVELGTVVCYAETAPGSGSEDAVVELLGSLLAVFTAESICGSLPSSVGRGHRT